MGIKSTYDIDRQTALDVILSKINNCTNGELAGILLNFDESYYRNYAVSDKLPEKPDHYNIIKTIDDFNNTDDSNI